MTFKPDPKPIYAGTDQAKKLLQRAFKRQPKQNNKYKAKKQGGAQGKIYDSQLEANYSNFLECQRLAGEIHSFETQKRLMLYVEGAFICEYRLDFVVMHNDGRIEGIEVKGMELPEWKRKWELTKALIPTGSIDGIPKDAKLTLVKDGGKGRFSHYPQLLNYK